MTVNYLYSYVIVVNVSLFIIIIEDPEPSSKLFAMISANLMLPVVCFNALSGFNTDAFHLFTKTLY